MKEYTKEQMEIWGQTNMVIGAGAVTAVHVLILLLGFPPLDWVWQGVLFVVLVPIGYLSYRQYQRTKERD